MLFWFPALVFVLGLAFLPAEAGGGADAGAERRSGRPGAPACRKVMLGDEGANLPQVLARLQAERPALRRASGDSWLVWRGAMNFFLPFPGGNGRACATCHDPRDGFSLSPARVEARWQALMKARRTNPCADDPLFRAIDADDGREDFTRLRTRALFRVRVPLPEHVRLTDHPGASEVTVLRAAAPLDILKHTGPYQQDRSADTLEQQAKGAVAMHMQPTTPPSPDFLASVAEFQRHLFSSRRLAERSRAIDEGRPPPEADPPLTPLERRGKERFDDLCGRCHGGPAQVQNLENRLFPPFDGSTNPAVLNLVVSNPPPPGFPPSPVQGPGFDLPAQRFTVRLPDGTSAVLASSDPGALLTDPRGLDKVAVNQVFNHFDIPQLHGINQTAPYFHDHRARTLEEVLLHYQVLFRFLKEARGVPFPLLADEDLAPIAAYMRRAL